MNGTPDDRDPGSEPGRADGGRPEEIWSVDGRLVPAQRRLCGKADLPEIPQFASAIACVRAGDQ